MQSIKSTAIGIVLCVLLISVLDAWRSEKAVRQELAPGLVREKSHELVSKLALLQQEQATTQAGEMISLLDQRRFPSHSISEAIAYIPGHQTHSNYVWHNSAGGVFAFAARGVDKNYHFSNSYLTGFLPFTTDKIWVPLATLAQRKIYQYDHVRYGRNMQDIWQNSEQAYLNSHGDCEDHAIILADWLIGLGYDARVAIGQLPEGGHAWVVLFYNNKEYLLEATSKRRPRSLNDFKLAKLETDYRPKYMFNRDHFWENTGSVFTTRYSGGNWQKHAEFRRL